MSSSWLEVVEGVLVFWWMKWEGEKKYVKRWVEGTEDVRRRMVEFWELDIEELGGREEVGRRFGELSMRRRDEDLELEEENEYYCLGNWIDSD